MPDMPAGLVTPFVALGMLCTRWLEGPPGRESAAFALTRPCVWLLTWRRFPVPTSPVLTSKLTPLPGLQLVMVAAVFRCA